jgi:hypothetical protein
LCISRAAAASSSTELSRAARRLGSAGFAERHEAGDQLMKAGASAIPFLREAAGSSVPEVRFRASELLQRIELQILDSQKSAILSGTLPEGELPAWDRYRQVVDDSEAARRLFILMLDRSPQLLLSFGAPDFQEAFDRRLNEWSSNTSAWPRRGGYGPEAAEELAVLLLAVSQPECAPTQSQAQLLGRSAEFPAFEMQLRPPSERSRPLRSLLTAWVVQPGRTTADARLRLASHYRLPEGLGAAREIIEADASGLETQNALLYVASFGEEQDIPRLEKILEETTELQTFRSNQPNVGMKTQIRDVALVALWKMRHEDPAAHGIRNYLESAGVPRPGAIGFPDDDERMAAITHWRNWRKRFVKADLPPDGWAVEGRSG